MAHLNLEDFESEPGFEYRFVHRSFASGKNGFKRAPDRDAGSRGDLILMRRPLPGADPVPVPPAVGPLEPPAPDATAPKFESKPPDEPVKAAITPTPPREE